MKSVFDYLPEINANTAEEMAVQAKLDFNAVKVDAYYDVVKEGEPDRQLIIPDKVAIVREDDGRYLGVVGRNRGVLQYRDMLKFTEALVQVGEAAYHKGGFTGNGGQAFIFMKANKFVRLAEFDKIECYFYIAASHDNTKSLEIVAAPLRKANNTVLTFLDSRIKFRHSRKINERLLTATDNIKRISDYFDTMQRSFTELRLVTINEAHLTAYLKALIPDPKENAIRTAKIRDEIAEIFYKGPACQLPSTRRNMLGAYFALVEWTDHHMQVRATKKRPNLYDAKLHNLLEGSGAHRKAKAFAFALDLSRKLGSVTLGGSLTPQSSDNFSSL